MDDRELIQGRFLCATYPRCGSHLLRTAFKQMTGLEMVPTHDVGREGDFESVITILRNPKDSVISRVAMQMHFDDSKPIEYYIEKSMFEYMEYYYYLSQNADHIFLYEDLLANTSDIVKILSNDLGIDLISESFVDDVESMSNKNHLKSSKVSDKYNDVVEAVKNFDFKKAIGLYIELSKKAKKTKFFGIHKLEYHHPEGVNHLNKYKSVATEIPGTEPKILKWEDVELSFSYITVEKEHVLEINDPCVLIFPTDRYYHLMVDDIAHYLYIKKFVPDVKPIFLQLVDNTKEEFREDLPYIKVLNHLGFSHVDVVPYSKDTNNILRVKTLYNHSLDNDDPFSMWKYPNLFKTLRENFFIPGMPSEKSFYVSRKMAKDRALDGEELIEDFFREKNFDVVYLEDLSFQEQLELFGGAKNIVARTGSSMTNLCFVHPDATIIDFNSNEDYYPSEWKAIAKTFDLNYIDIYVGDTEKSDTIIKRLKSLSVLNQGVF